MGKSHGAAAIPLKRQIHDFLDSWYISGPLDIANCVLSFVIVSVYIYSTYDPLYFVRDMFTHWYPTTLMGIHVFFLIEYLLRLYTAQNFSTYFLSLQSFVEIATIFPYIIVSLAVEDPMSFWNYFVRMLDLLRILTLFRALKYIENDINRELCKIIIGALALVIGFTGYIQLLEYRYALTTGDFTKYQTFFDVFFFIMTTISIVGYYSPVESFEGKISIIVLMSIVVIVIPNQSSKMVQLISSKSVYARRKYKSIDKIPHIVLIGSVS